MKSYKMQVDEFLATATFEEANARSEALWEESSVASRALGAFVDQFPKGPMNLTPEHVRAMPEYKELRLVSDRLNEQQRIFSAAFVKKFKKQYLSYLDARRAAKVLANANSV